MQNQNNVLDIVAKFEVALKITNNKCFYKYRDKKDKLLILCGEDLPNSMGIYYNFKVEKEEFQPNKPNDKKRDCNIYRVLAFCRNFQNGHTVSNSEFETIEYLSHSGLFDGISERIAKEIYSMYGDKSIELIEKDINILNPIGKEKENKIKGIGVKTFEIIKSSYEENISNVEKMQLFKELLPIGFSPKQIERIYAHFKRECNTIIKENTYKLCNIKRIDLCLIDALAKKHNISKDNYNRYLKIARTTINNYMYKGSYNVDNGSTCCDYEDFIYNYHQILSKDFPEISLYEIRKKVDEFCEKEVLKRVQRIDGDDVIYTMSTYKAEHNVCNEVIRLLRRNELSISNFDQLLEETLEEMFLEDNVKIVLDENQKLAIKNALENPIFIITGGPGTGKTTILKIIAKINKKIHKNEQCIFLAPTGRAARRMYESSGFDARTVHKYFGIGEITNEEVEDELDIDDQNNNFSNGDDFDNKLFIIDESSFIDICLANKILSRIGSSRVIFVGDIDQLPSIGPGTFLRDLIESSKVKYTKLDTIHRQANDSKNIIDNAKKIKKGKKNLTYGDDFILKEANTEEEIENTIVDIFCKESQKYGVNNVKVITPTNKEICGVLSLNKKIQSLLPYNEENIIYGNDGEYFRVKDLVMQLKNEDDVANGDIGVVTHIDKTTKSMTCQFALDTEEPISKDYVGKEDVEKLKLAYASTIHKSQGSEYPIVICHISQFNKSMLQRNLIYTAITRASKRVYLVGDKASIDYAIDNNKIVNRKTGLALMLREANLY